MTKELLPYDKACQISDHLLINGLGFCLLESSGLMVTREDCQKVIDEYNTLKPRLCLRCNDQLHFGDDPICGYHHLED